MVNRENPTFVIFPTTRSVNQFAGLSPTLQRVRELLVAGAVSNPRVLVRTVEPPRVVIPARDVAVCGDTWAKEKPPVVNQAVRYF